MPMILRLHKVIRFLSRGDVLAFILCGVRGDTNAQKTLQIYGFFSQFLICFKQLGLQLSKLHLGI